jgi:hypothetical protein
MRREAIVMSCTLAAVVEKLLFMDYILNYFTGQKKAKRV